MRILLAAGLLTVPAWLNAQSTPPLEFEVASIKPNRSQSNSSRISSAKGIWRATNISGKSLLLNAFDILPEQLVGAPAWIDSDTFDIEAKAEFDPSTSRADESKLMRQCLQALLASRFDFQMHRETRQLQTYALVVGKKGVKLTPAENKEGSSTNVRNGHMEAKGTTMDLLARSLSGWLGRPTVNETGITGRFDLTLDFEPERTVRPTTSDTPLAGVEPAKPSLITAVQDQLGLKLETRKSAVELLVVDRIARPSEN